MAADIIPFTGQAPGAPRERVPPHNIEVERALVGALLLNNKAYDRVADFLLPEHFAEAVNGRIFDAIRKLIAKNQPANAVTLKTHLENDELLRVAGGFNYLASLANSMVTVINAADYGRMIYDLHLRRELITLGEDMVNAAYDLQIDDTAAGLMEDAASRMAQLTSDGAEHKPVLLYDAVQTAINRWDKHHKGEIAGTSTGLMDLDREMGLLEPGDLVVIAGASSMGKTSLAMTLAYNAAKQFRDDAARSGTKPKRAVVFSGEMSATELASRAMTTHTGIQGPRKRSSPLVESEWSQLQTFAQEIAQLPLVIDERSAPSLSYVRSRARQEARKGGVGMIVVDYLQIMSPDAGRKNDNRVEELSTMVRGLKTLARTMNCVLICLCSINRQVDNRDNKRPHLGDIKGCGDIEFAADIVAFPYRAEYYLERNEPAGDKQKHGAWQMEMEKVRGTAEVIIGKSRNSGIGTAHLYFDRTRTLFADLARDPGSDEQFETGRLL